VIHGGLHCTDQARALGESEAAEFPPLPLAFASGSSLVSDPPVSQSALTSELGNLSKPATARLRLRATFRQGINITALGSGYFILCL